ncbi:HelD family protein [Kitasatospora sp. KL5]|uniref:HelD family protein n=1 Tax=Kitasatospora sp. KL5 TaxID=3425125 RepID=UPI003D6FB303
MYALLDRQTAELRDELGRLLKAPAEESGGAYARDAAAEHLTGRLRRLEGAGQGLCFGRIDHADGTALHIGRLGLHTDDRELPLLVDWRADAARPFYTATPVHPLGLRRRRHLRLEERTVREISDELLDGTPPAPDDLVADGPLIAALEARRTGRMGTAVSTLQAEQDAIVRSPHRGVSVVQGGPGTGKTVVALHRAAYALYAFPRAAEQGVLVLGPNTRFLDYISHVLPSLGENDVVLATTADLAGVRPTAHAPAPVARLKGTAVMAEALAALVRTRQAPAGDFAVQVGQEWIRLDRHEVAAARNEALRSGLAHNRAREVFKEQLVDAVTDAAARATTDTLERIDAEVARATGLDLDRATRADLRNLGFDGPATDVTDEIDHDALRADLAQRAQVDHAVDRLWPRLSARTLVDALLTDPDALAAHLPALSTAELACLLRTAGGPWTGADLPLLDEAAALVDGPPERSFGHVVVDEAQELSAMQWRMVLRRCPTRSMTLVGDFAQAGPAADARDWTGALAPHLGTRFALHTLTVSYRTTQEILASTRDLLTRIAPDQTPAGSIRHGEVPRTVTARPRPLVEALVAELRHQAEQHPGDLRAVVCADHRTVEFAQAGVDGWATIVPASEARGLEFDTVLVAGPDEITTARPCGERDLYVALTRATKRLVTLV